MHDDSHRSDRARERSPRRRSPSRGQGGHRHGGDAPPPPKLRLSSIIVAPFHFTPPPPAAATPPTVSIDKFTAQLHELMLSGLSAARTAMPTFLGIPSPTSAPRGIAMSPFGTVCRDWLAGISAAPPGFTVTSSRLAAPAVSFALPATAKAGFVLAREAGVVAAALDANPELSAWGADMDNEDATVHPKMDLGSCVLFAGEGKETWDEEEEGEDARQPGAALADDLVCQDADALVIDQEGERAAIGDLLLLDEAQQEDTEEEVAAAISMDEIDEEAAIGDLLSPTVQADTATITTAQRAVAVFFSQPEVSLLPTPAPRAPALPLPPRRSDRLADKPQMLAMDKAKNVLYTKMGIKILEMPLLKATKEFYKTEMPDVAVAAVGTLLKLNLPLVLAGDEALIAMAGAGGTELATTAVDVSA